MRFVKIIPALMTAGSLYSYPLAAEELQLDEVLVSAGRTPVEVEKVGRAHTIITSEQIEKSQARHVSDLLRRVPGFAVSRSGSVGSLTQIRVRGSEANHVLVLIDGIEVATTVTGEFDFGGLQTAGIERIEILRGPQSALYGSNAMSGVISIYTKKGQRGTYRTTGQVEVGTARSVATHVGMQGGGENYDISLSGAFQRTDGHDISISGGEKDGDRNVTLNSRFNWDINEDLNLDLSLRYVNHDAESDDQDFGAGSPTEGQAVDFAGYNISREIYGGAGLTWMSLDGLFESKIRGEITDIGVEGLGSFGESANDDRRYHASYQGTYFFDTPSLSGTHSLTGAVEWERELYQNKRPSTAAQRPEQSRDMYGFALEYRGEFFEDLFVSGALRHDVNEDFDNATTYSMSAAYLLRETNTRFHASVGTGVTNPTFSEQFGFFPGSFQGNPNLTPEENFGWDVGVEQKFLENRLVVDVTYFQERLEDEISTAFLPGFVSTPVNLDGTSKRQGIEVAGSFDVTDALQFNASYSYVHSEQPNGADEVRRPNHTASLGVNYAYADGLGNLFLDAVFNGKMDDNEFNSTTPQTIVTLDNYLVVNIGADYQLSENVNIYGRIENLFDENYEEVYTYQAPGIGAFIGVKATF